jgi:hypothetical protein
MTGQDGISHRGLQFFCCQGNLQLVFEIFSKSSASLAASSNSGAELRAR